MPSRVLVFPVFDVDNHICPAPLMHVEAAA